MPTPADEGRHRPEPHPDWHEVWSFTAWTPGGDAGATATLALWPMHDRAWYSAALVRQGWPVLHVADLDVALPRRGLEIRSHGLWAAHTCEAAHEQWTVANEAYAVALDDPDEALGAARGRPSPVAFDLEWYAAAPPAPFAGGATSPDGLDGYGQAGEVHGVIELAEGPLAVEGPAHRQHWWGLDDPWPPPPADWPPAGLAAPVRLSGPGGRPFALDRVLTATGWQTARRWL